MRSTTIAARLVLAVLFLSAGAAAFGASAASAEVPKSCISIIAPGSEAVLAPGRVLVIGTAKGEGLSNVDVDVNGKGKQTVGVKGGGFSVPVTLSRGKNAIRVAAGKTSVTVVVSVEGAGAYRYHPEIEKCASCHDAAERGHLVAGRKDALCYRCHDKQDAAKNVHGPLGGGECTACHDPHGSGNAALTVARPESLCLTCHDQESSADHVRRARGKACTSCHEPHASDKQFLQR